MEHYKQNIHDDFFDFKSPLKTSISYPTPEPSMSMVPTLGNIPSSSVNDNDALQYLKTGFVKMLSTMERMEQRISRMEQTTNQILKNQQEVLQVPFMSQNEIDKARQVAEQLEQDTSVAKQLQAAYNTEVELRKSKTPQHQSRQSINLSECPICGFRVAQMDLEAHVDQCLEMFSNDPKKEIQIQDTKKKIETGFFGRLFKTTKTETTKTVSTQSATAPLLPEHQSNSTSSMYPGFGYPQYMYPGMNQGQSNNQQSSMPMMMPMYMYPSYPPMNSQSSE